MPTARTNRRIDPADEAFNGRFRPHCVTLDCLGDDRIVDVTTVRVLVIDCRPQASDAT